MVAYYILSDSDLCWCHSAASILTSSLAVPEAWNGPAVSLRGLVEPQWALDICVHQYVWNEFTGTCLWPSHWPNYQQQTKPAGTLNMNTLMHQYFTKVFIKNTLESIHKGQLTCFFANETDLCLKTSYKSIYISIHFSHWKYKWSLDGEKGQGVEYPLICCHFQLQGRLLSASHSRLLVCGSKTKAPPVSSQNGPVP